MNTATETAPEDLRRLSEVWSRGASTDPIRWGQYERYFQKKDPRQILSTNPEPSHEKGGFRYWGYYRRSDGFVHKLEGFVSSGSSSAFVGQLAQLNALEPVFTVDAHAPPDALPHAKVQSDTDLERDARIVTRANQEIRTLFLRNRDEFFEDGMTSAFLRGLISVETRYEEFAIAAMATEILSARANEELASEALRWIGRIGGAKSYKRRLSLLEKALLSDFPKIRDGAVLGLSSIDDASALPGLKAAIEDEKIDSLRQDMEQLILQLEEDR